jgi:hypothetical protein
VDSLSPRCHDPTQEVIRDVEEVMSEMVDKSREPWFAI